MKTTTTQGKPAYGREMAREYGTSLMMPFRGTWRGRYIWWAQYLEGALFAGALLAVWALAGGTTDDPGAPGPWWTVAAAFLGIAVLTSLVEAEARVTERRLERARVAAGARDGADIPDGYVLAYEIGNAAGQLGDELADPFLIVAAVRADRWDLYEPLWRFSVRQSSIGGLIVQLPAGGLAGVSALGGFFTELDEGQLRDLNAAERALAARGARDLTAAALPPAV